MRKYLIICRFWLLRILLTKTEKYLLKQAVEDRIYSLERLAVNERWVDKDNIGTDVADYSKLKQMVLPNIDVNGLRFGY